MGKETLTRGEGQIVLDDIKKENLLLTKKNK